MPQTRADFWQKKINGNGVRDRKIEAALRSSGWRLVVIWECAVRTRVAAKATDAVQRAADWIRSGRGAAIVIPRTASSFKRAQ
jgi:DNA mismatch endonuclease, patch repair protein